MDEEQIEEMSAEDLRRLALEKEAEQMNKAADKAAANGGLSTAKTWIRDLGVSVVSIAGLIRELFFVEDPNATLILILGGFLGVPFVMKADKLRNIGG